MPLQTALELAAGVDEIYTVKGKKILHVDLRKEKPPPEELAKMLLGPSGNLRAPAARRGRALIVGFDPEIYLKLLR